MTDRIEFTVEATDALDEHITYIAARNPIEAERIREEIARVLAMLAAASPRVEGSCVTLRSSGLECRRWVAGRLVIFYLRGAGVLSVLRIHHHAREPIAR